ncbi:MAG: hypothetical protein OXF56_27440 [Rhodobacteraceae bacterium]|nr:hypothetical protein [Paracoccaceae bacterium]
MTGYICVNALRFLTAAGLLASLAGCETFRIADQRADSLASEAARHRGLLASQQRGGVVKINQPFYGNRGSLNDDDRAKRHNRGTPLPDEFQQDLGVEIMTKVPVDIDTVRTIITGATGLDVVLRTTYPTQTGVIEVPVSGTLLVDHRGPLSSLLDRVGSRFDLSWSFDGSSIRFDRMVNVAYDVPLPPTSGTLGAEVTGVRTGTSSISSGKSVKVDPWAEITDALKQVVPPPASVTLSPNTGKITVFGPPSVQQTAGEIIDQFSDVYLKRIGLEIATYFVDADRNGEVGFGAFLQGLFDDYQASLGQPAQFDGSISSAGISGKIAIVDGNFSGSSLDFSALASEKDVVDYRLTNTVGQSGVIAPVSLLSTQNYVRESSSRTDSEGEVTHSLKVDSIDTGLSIFALPRLINNDRIQLSLWIVQASLNSLDKFGSIQLPKTDHRAVEYTVVLTPGETLIIGGYEQETVRKGQRGAGVAGFLGLGGSARAELIRTSMIILVRPTLIGS